MNSIEKEISYQSTNSYSTLNTLNAKTKTVWLDDSWYGIQIDDEETTADNQFEFAEIVKILLTDKQQNDFIMIDTNTF